MKINEIIDPTLEEGWKEKLATLGLAGAMGIGGAAYDYAKNPETGPKIIKSLVGKKSVANTPEPVPNTPPSAKAAPKIQKPTVAAKKIDVSRLSEVLPNSAKILKKHALEAGITGTELIQLLAQAQHETANFTRTEEIGNKHHFKKYDPKFNPRKAKTLGNIKPGDGEKYKGRGFLQITGRWNYREAGKALGLPLEAQPELLNRPEIAAKVSIWFWNTVVKPNVNNFKDVKHVTKKINPGLAGLNDRIQKFQDLMKAAVI
jgi:putative chitinase